MIGYKLEEVVSNHGNRAAFFAGSGDGGRQDRGGGDFVDSLYSTIRAKRSLSSPSSRSAYVYFSTGVFVPESDLSDDKIQDFILSMDVDSRRSLLYYLFSIDSPKVHYYLFKSVQDKMLSVQGLLRSHGLGALSSFYDAYLFSLSLVGRVFFRDFHRDHPLSLSLLLGDILLIHDSTRIGDRDFSDLVFDLSQDMERLRSSLDGRLMFYPRRVDGYWRLVDVSHFLSNAPNDLGDIPSFLKRHLRLAGV